MREIVHLQAGQCGNQIGAKVRILFAFWNDRFRFRYYLFVKGPFRSFESSCHLLLPV